MPAFTVMRQMAAAPSIQGKWEEVEGGYRLIGKKWTAQEMAAKVTKFPAPPFRDDSFDPLPEDKRLQKTLNVQMNDARVGDIVQRIQAATGVALIVENVDLETPLYGSINFPNVMAWSMMRNLAEHQRIQGSWEKNGEGYRLRGTRPPQPVVAVAPPIGVNPMPAKTDVAAPTPPRTSLYICFGVFSTITIGAIVAIAIWLIGRKNLTAEA
jgi:hypothetical protein